MEFMIQIIKPIMSKGSRQQSIKITKTLQKQPVNQPSAKYWTNSLNVLLQEQQEAPSIPHKKEFDGLTAYLLPKQSSHLNHEMHHHKLQDLNFLRSDHQNLL